MMLHHSKAAAVVLSLVILCSLASFCQAFPWFWRDETSREEQRHIAADAAARVVSSVLKALIQQNELPVGQCSLNDSFNLTGPGVDLDQSTVTFTKTITGRVIKEHFNFVCRNDYRLYVHKNRDSERLIENNNITYTCEVDAGASYQTSIDELGEPRCAIPCTVLQNIQNGTVSVDGNQPRPEGDTAEYSCNSGYQLNGTRTRTCGEDGQWSGQEPSCIPQCPELQDITNGAVSYISRQPGATASYSCDSGYQLSGTLTRTCGEDGQWSGQESSCIPLVCPELQEIANGDVHYTSRQPGGTATYSCDPGYVLQGATTRTCGEDGKWSGQEPRCVRLCPVLAAPSNGAVNYHNRKPGDVATYSCRDGYRLVGPEMRICARDQDGKWSGIHPVCEILCPLVNPIPHGGMNADRSPVPGTGGRFPVDTVVNYTCDNGYLLCGEDTRICLRSGEWDRPEPNCHVHLCPELSAPPNGTVGYGNREPGDVATYSCRHGYRLVGSETRICERHQDGIPKWSGKPSVCEILCPLVNPIIPNGDVDADKSPIPGPGGGFPVDTVVTYTCDNGYLLRGEDTRMCLRSGEWDHPEPSCEPQEFTPPVICSPDSLPIPNGEFSPSSGLIRAGPGGSHGYGVGTMITYRCVSDRFELRGESSIICLQSGQWSHPPPECFAVRCPKLRLSGNPRSVDKTRQQILRDRPRDYQRLLIETFFKKNIKGNLVPYDEGSTAKLTCIRVDNNGWTLMSNSPSVQTCVRNSTSGDLYWTKPGICVYRYSITKPALTGGTG